jgi:hypothetical protein
MVCGEDGTGSGGVVGGDDPDWDSFVIGKAWIRRGYFLYFPT